MLEDDQNNLIALVGSRICHDLISPIGAIGNGLELLEMAEPAVSPEMALITDSVASANARIRFFRIAFGLAPADSVLARGEIARVIDDTFRGSRQSVVWTPTGTQPRDDVKLAFLCIQCLETAMPQGGEITVTRSETGWELTGETAVLRLADELWRPLTCPYTTMRLTASDVHFGVLRQLTLGREPALSVEVGTNRVTMRF